MFMEQRQLESFSHDLQGRELCKKVETVYLFENQIPNEKNLSPETQSYYKKLFIKQEDHSNTIGRPISIFEILHPL